MVQLWFNTGISWITNPSNVVSSSKQPIPDTSKIPFPKDKPLLASTTMVGVVKPKRSDENVVTNAAYEIAKAAKTDSNFDAVMDKYINQLSTESFYDAKNIASDLLAGSGADEMASAYSNKWFSTDIIKDTHYGYSLLNGDVPDVTTDATSGIWTIAGVGAWAIAGAGIAWLGLEKAGSAIYWAGFWENKLAVSSEIKWRTMKWIRQTALETPWVWWTELRVGKKAYEWMNKTRDNEIAPYVNKNIKVTSVDDLVTRAKNKLIKSAKFSKDKLNQIVAEIEDWWNGMRETYPKGINQNQAHKITSEMWQDLDSVFKKTSKWVIATPITNENKWALLQLRSTLRSMFLDSVSKNSNATKPELKAAFQKYGNLSAVVEQSEKDLAQRLLGWPLGMSSAIIKKSGMPAVTIAGKSLYNIGKWLQLPAKLVIDWAKKIISRMWGGMAWAEMIDINEINKQIHNSKIGILQWALKNGGKSWINKQIYDELGWEKWVLNEISKLKSSKPKQVPSAVIDILLSNK